MKRSAAGVDSFFNGKKHDFRYIFVRGNAKLKRDSSFPTRVVRKQARASASPYTRRSKTLLCSPPPSVLVVLPPAPFPQSGGTEPPAFRSSSTSCRTSTRPGGTPTTPSRCGAGRCLTGAGSLTPQCRGLKCAFVTAGGPMRFSTAPRTRLDRSGFFSW